MNVKSLGIYSPTLAASDSYELQLARIREKAEAGQGRWIKSIEDIDHGVGATPDGGLILSVGGLVVNIHPDGGLRPCAYGFDDEG